MKPVYHYTTGDCLVPIFEAEQINPASKGVMPPEIPAVWLSVAPEWEMTASKGIIGGDGIQRTATIEQMIEMAGSICRIEIDPSEVRLIPPLKMSESLKISKLVMESLLESARNMGANPSDWRAVAGPVPLSAFVRVELAKTCDPIKWVSIEF